MQQTIHARSYDTPQETTLVSELRYSHVKWGSIFGGWLLAAAVAMLLYTVGAAIGISAINFTDLQALSTKTIFLSGIWMLVTWAVSLYFGGYFASASSNEVSKRSGVLHGVGVWALAMVLTAIVGTAGIGATAVTGIFAAGAAASAGENLDVPQNYQVQIKDAVNGFIGEINNNATNDVAQAVKEIDAKDLGTISAAFLRGDQDAAIDSLVYHTSLTREEATEIATELDAATQEAKVRAKETADKAAAFSSMALGAGVLISLLALLAAIAGGSAGARAQYAVVQTSRSI